MREISVLLVGVGGYGEVYARAMLEEGSALGLCLAGVADPFAARCTRIAELSARAPVFASMEDFFAAGLSADLAVIATPIGFHAPMIYTALAHGCHVLCEKPLCADDAQAEEILSAARASGKLVSVGYQWAHCMGMNALKDDILAGVYGAPKRMRTLCLVPRDDKYFARSTGWAGRIRDAQGRLVNDSPVNNAVAHYLFNMLWLLGRKGEAYAPEHVEALLARANKIENFDTAALRVDCGGVPVFFYTTHAGQHRVGYRTLLEFARGCVTYDSSGDRADVIIGECADGSVRKYPALSAPEEMEKLRRIARAIRGECALCCSASASAAQTRVITMLQKNKVFVFPPDRTVRMETPARVYVPGLDETLVRAYDEACLPEVF